MATHERPHRLARALEALGRQAITDDAYEIVVVDDGSGPDTGGLLRRYMDTGNGPALTVLRQDPARGPAVARNLGWRQARAPLIAFTDDDCEATPGWVSALLDVAAANPGAIVQGPTLPNPAEAHDGGDFPRTLSRTRLGPWFETANILYPRALLDRVGGFDEEAFSGPGGEDTDLAWKAIYAGAPVVWAPDATVYHAVTRLGLAGALRNAWRWDETMLCFKRHPALRKELIWGVFWTYEHLWLALAILGGVLPRLPRPARVALASAYAKRLYAGRRTPTLAPFRLVYDLVETAACIRGALRYRVLVL
jgi:GT2 family glycosyltransferase